MSRSYETNCASVICPFFIGKDRNKIVCEGIVAGSSMSMSFASPADCVTWRKDFCSKDYPLCPFAGFLNDKWDKILERRH